MQVICPFVLDQFYWAERMAWLGVAPPPLRPEHLIVNVHGSVEDYNEAVRVVSCAIAKACKTEMRACASNLGKKIHSEVVHSSSQNGPCVNSVIVVFHEILPSWV
jgi:UDP:flavonoid glycosyltransferase YjiC (YdhE family)